MGRHHRPETLDESKRERIRAILTAGGNLLTAARYVGCSVHTIERVAERDPAFAAQLRESLANCELGLVDMIRSAARQRGAWRAAAWLLERLFPEQFVRRDAGDVTVDQVETLLAQIAAIVTDELPERDRKIVIQRLDVLARDLGGGQTQRLEHE